MLLGNLFPGIFQVVASWEYASVNLVVAVLIWAMVYPMMVAVDFSAIRDAIESLLQRATDDPSLEVVASAANLTT